MQCGEHRELHLEEGIRRIAVGEGVQPGELLHVTS
jgi:hypothetical protein